MKIKMQQLQALNLKDFSRENKISQFVILSLIIIFASVVRAASDQAASLPPQPSQKRVAWPWNKPDSALEDSFEPPSKEDRRISGKTWALTKALRRGIQKCHYDDKRCLTEDVNFSIITMQRNGEDQHYQIVGAMAHPTLWKTNTPENITKLLTDKTTKNRYPLKNPNGTVFVNLCEEANTKHYPPKALDLFHHKDDGILNFKIYEWPMYDHTAPPFGSIMTNLEKLYAYYNAGKSVIFHCKAGKGRTGTVVAMFLLYCMHKDEQNGSHAWLKRMKETMSRLLLKNGSRLINKNESLGRGVNAYLPNRPPKNGVKYTREEWERRLILTYTYRGKKVTRNIKLDFSKGIRVDKQFDKRAHFALSYFGIMRQNHGKTVDNPMQVQWVVYFQMLLQKLRQEHVTHIENDQEEQKQNGDQINSSSDETKTGRINPEYALRAFQKERHPALKRLTSITIVGGSLVDYVIKRSENCLFNTEDSPFTELPTEYEPVHVRTAKWGNVAFIPFPKGIRIGEMLLLQFTSKKKTKMEIYIPAGAPMTDGKLVLHCPWWNKKMITDEEEKITLELTFDEECYLSQKDPSTPSTSEEKI